ncbi:MAG TPA: hypothetical protein EYH07_17755 [Kiloniellaceae bacterium]|nr:hypothetical protein [Kiloniellaceae bacterium]HIP80289.1 hypothetical protein [Kiloniellaceae bacterium]
MIYHLYDNNRQHLAMSESFEELQGAALQAFEQDDLPYAYVRWSDASGQQQELRVTSESITAARRPVAAPATPSYGAAQTARRRSPQRSARQRANLFTGVAILFLLLYLTSEFVSMFGY